MNSQLEDYLNEIDKNYNINNKSFKQNDFYIQYIKKIIKLYKQYIYNYVFKNFCYCLYYLIINICNDSILLTITINKKLLTNEITNLLNYMTLNELKQSNVYQIINRQLTNYDIIRLIIYFYITIIIVYYSNYSIFIIINKLLVYYIVVLIIYNYIIHSLLNKYIKLINSLSNNLMNLLYILNILQSTYLGKRLVDIPKPLSSITSTTNSDYSIDSYISLRNHIIYNMHSLHYKTNKKSCDLLYNDNIIYNKKIIKQLNDKLFQCLSIYLFDIFNDNTYLINTISSMLYLTNSIHISVQSTNELLIKYSTNRPSNTYLTNYISLRHNIINYRKSLDYLTTYLFKLEQKLIDTSPNNQIEISNYVMKLLNILTYRHYSINSLDGNSDSNIDITINMISQYRNEINNQLDNKLIDLQYYYLLTSLLDIIDIKESNQSITNNQLNSTNKNTLSTTTENVTIQSNSDDLAFNKVIFEYNNEVISSNDDSLNNFKSNNFVDVYITTIPNNIPLDESDDKINNQLNNNKNNYIANQLFSELKNYMLDFKEPIERIKVLPNDDINYEDSINVSNNDSICQVDRDIYTSTNINRIVHCELSNILSNRLNNNENIYLEDDN